MGVDVRSVRGIHQPDHGMIDAAGKGLALHPARLRIGNGHARRRAPGLAVPFVIGDIDPDEPILLAHRIAAHADAVRLQRLALDGGGDERAHAVCPEAPSVIGALDRVLGEHLAGRERHAAMRADIAQREDLAVLHPPDDDRLAQQHLPAHAAALHIAGQRRHVPAVGEEFGLVGHVHPRMSRPAGADHPVGLRLRARAAVAAGPGASAGCPAWR